MDTRRKQPQKKIDKTKFSPVEMPIAQLLFSIENNAGSLKISGTQGSHEVCFGILSYVLIENSLMEKNFY